ncbi:MAG: GDP-mannose 4,6-dehydratase [archaeon]|nr:GDP-mannose 4,6-dehydratase [archaeon]
MRVLVTGGAGFIGSSLCESLLGKGHEVLCVDNFDDYYNPKAKHKNIKACLENEKFKLVEANILDDEAMETAFSEFKPERIAHFAAFAGVRASLQDPVGFMDLNSNGTIKLLDLSIKHEAGGFLLASTSAVYGKPEKSVFLEDTNIMPLSPYAISKRTAELFCYQYSQINGLNISIPRFFTVYGPRQRPDMAIHKFTKLIDEGKEIPVFGSLESERDYAYISDVTNAVCAALEKNPEFEIFNLGHSKPTSLGKVVSTIEKNLEKKAKIKILPWQDCEPHSTCAGIEKAERLLNFKPKTSFEEGIEKFIEWYKNC